MLNLNFQLTGCLCRRAWGSGADLRYFDMCDFTVQFHIAISQCNFTVQFHSAISQHNFAMQFFSAILLCDFTVPFCSAISHCVLPLKAQQTFQVLMRFQGQRQDLGWQNLLKNALRNRLCKWIFTWAILDVIHKKSSTIS
jgi:hypothetical protein